MFRLTKRVMAHYAKRDGNVACYTCGKSLSLGELVVSVSEDRRRGKLRCHKCARRILLIR